MLENHREQMRKVGFHIFNNLQQSSSNTKAQPLITTEVKAYFKKIIQFYNIFKKLFTVFSTNHGKSRDVFINSSVFILTLAGIIQVILEITERLLHMGGKLLSEVSPGSGQEGAHSLLDSVD